MFKGREFRFRAWDSKKSRMIKQNKREVTFKCPKTKHNLLPCYDGLVMMQYTEEFDVEETEICEFDIVEFDGWEGEYYTVHYECASFILKPTPNNSSRVYRNSKIVSGHRLRIVGNVFENSILLK